MRSPRTWWSLYAVCAVVVMLALAWITVEMVRLEQAEAAARTDARFQEAQRLALWRMDSWLAPHFAREAARPYADYQPFYVQEAFAELAGEVESDEVFTPSPLLTTRSEYIRLHFQLSPEGLMTSPQVPVGQLRDVAERGFLSAVQIETDAQVLSRIGSALTRSRLDARLEQEVAEQTAIKLRHRDVRPSPGKQEAKEKDQTAAEAGKFLDQSFLNSQEFARRVSNLQRDTKPQQAPDAADGLADEDDWGGIEESLAVPGATRTGRLRPSDAPRAQVGSFQSFWAAEISPAKEELVFFRHVFLDDRSYFQGFVCDWPRLETALLDQIRDLFDEAELEPRRAPPANESELGTLLATVPVSLNAVMSPPAPAGRLTPKRLTLLISWLAVLAGLAAVAVTLRSVVAFGTRRSRFASAVTHELRTPLTTFRMYTEMLSEGMVKDEDTRQAYLKTLSEESNRLAMLVENVLEFARLEEGRRPARIESMNVGALLDNVVPPLERRALEAGMVLEMDCQLSDCTILRADASAVGHILLNLVDNACKYAAEAEDRTIHVEVRTAGSSFRIAVQDQGAGVPEGSARAIFSSFERGVNRASAKPGVGLGLALSRGLARDLGGDLTLDRSGSGGACFVLTLPLSA